MWSRSATLPCDDEAIPDCHGGADDEPHIPSDMLNTVSAVGLLRQHFDSTSSLAMECTMYLDDTMSSLAGDGGTPSEPASSAPTNRANSVAPTTSAEAQRIADEIGSYKATSDDERRDNNHLSWV